MEAAAAEHDAIDSAVYARLQNSGGHPLTFLMAAYHRCQSELGLCRYDDAKLKLYEALSILVCAAF